MKWYLWLAIALVLFLVVYFGFINKKSSSLNPQMLASNTGSVFNPYEIKKIS